MRRRGWFVCQGSKAYLPEEPEEVFLSLWVTSAPSILLLYLNTTHTPSVESGYQTISVLWINHNSTQVKNKQLPLHVSVYTPPHLIILHLAAPVSLSTAARHRACALWSGETRKEAQGLQHEYTRGRKVLVTAVRADRVAMATYGHIWAHTHLDCLLSECV